MIVLSILGHIFFFLFLLFGLVCLFFGLPGTWMIVGAIALYGLVTGFTEIGGGMLLLLGLLTLAGEVVEYLFGIAGARRFGSSNRGIVFSILGGFAGAVLGAPLFFGFGAILGALVGAFMGAVLIELLTYGPTEWKKALRSGWGNFLGRIAGVITKMAIAIGMIVWTTATLVM
jgi:uncharacterized protein YqgC (DUF456 family)